MLKNIKVYFQFIYHILIACRLKQKNLFQYKFIAFLQSYLILTLINITAKHLL